MKRKEKNRGELSELVGGLVIILWLFLLLLPVLFDFQSATVVGKIFMIIGSSIFLLIYIALFVLTVKDKSNDIYKTRRQKIWAIIFFIVILILYVWLLLGYFDSDIWGTLEYVVMGAFLIMVMYGCYSLVNGFRPLLNNEKITVVLIAAALFLAYLSGLFSDIYEGVADILIKIAVGILYLFFISFLLNILVFNKPKKEIKNRIIMIAILVVVGVALLILFPFYVQWCGFTGDNFEVFVTTYSAVVGGALTLLGVALTIKYERQVSKDADIEKIKPFLVIDTSMESYNYNQIKQISFGKYFKDIKLGQDSTYYFGRPIFRNVSDNVCILDYIRINNEKYKFLFPYAILSNQQFYLTINNQIKSFSLENEPLKEIYIGIYDKAYHLYEFKLIFNVMGVVVPDNNIDFEEVPENMVIRQGTGQIIYKSLHIKYVDCSTVRIDSNFSAVGDRHINEIKTEFENDFNLHFDKES